MRFNNSKKKVDIVVLVKISGCTVPQMLAWLMHRKSPGNFYKRTFWREGGKEKFEQLQRLGAFEMLVEGTVGMEEGGVGVVVIKELEVGKSAGLKRCR